MTEAVTSHSVQKMNEEINLNNSKSSPPDSNLMRDDLKPLSTNSSMNHGDNYTYSTGESSSAVSGSFKDKGKRTLESIANSNDEKPHEQASVEINAHNLDLPERKDFGQYDPEEHISTLLQNASIDIPIHSSRKPSLSAPNALVEEEIVDEKVNENDPEAVLVALKQMGFDDIACEMAISEAYGILWDAKEAGIEGQRGTLLENAIGSLLNAGAEKRSSVAARGITYSPPGSPKPNRPPPPNYRPTKGILKPAPPNTFLRTATSLLSRITSTKNAPWIGKTIDSASSVASSLAAKFNEALESQSSHPSNMNVPMTRARSSYPAPATDPKPNNPQSNFVISESQSSLPGSLSSSVDSLPSSLGIESPISSKPKLVRFSVPNLQIDPVDDANYSESDDENVYNVDEEVIDYEHPEPTIHPIKPSAFKKVIDPKLNELQNFYLVVCEYRSEKPLASVIPQLAVAKPKCIVFDELINEENVSSISDFIGQFLASREKNEMITLKFLGCGLKDETLKLIIHAVLHVNSCKLEFYITGTKNSDGSFGSDEHITAVGIKYLAVFLKKSENLTHLSISHITMAKKSISYLSHALMHTKSLESLSLDHTKLQLSLLSPSILQSPVTKLSLCGNRVFPELKIFNKLSVLNLDSCGVNDVLYIAEGLMSSETLKELILSRNSIDAHGLSLLSQALKQNKTLQKLDLSYNPICENSLEGISALKDALSANKTLTELNLTATGLNSEAAIILAETIPLSTSLTSLLISQNPLQVAGIIALSVSLKMNSSITNVELVPIAQIDVDGENSNISDVIERSVSEVLEICDRNKARYRPSPPPTPARPPIVKRTNSLNEKKSLSREEKLILELKDIVRSAEETAALLNEIISENGDLDGLGKELYTEVTLCRTRLQKGIPQILEDEVALGLILSLNDKLEVTVLNYENKIREKNIQKSQTVNTNETTIPTLEELKTVSTTEFISEPDPTTTSISTPVVVKLKEFEKESAPVTPARRQSILEEVGNLYDVENDVEIDLKGTEKFSNIGDGFEDEMKEIDEFLSGEK
ncbi:hypothetical protein HK098_005353 [Nowakowskiella sp. JEL0407]|nr:hypothetical protein HK098_005353 [Nowakowskiella sp. JEL0407]